MKKTLIIGGLCVLAGVVLERMTGISQKVPGVNTLKRA